MTKKEYITPEIENIDAQIESALAIGTGDNGAGDGEIDDPDDIAAKEWPFTFNEDEP